MRVNQWNIMEGHQSGQTSASAPQLRSGKSPGQEQNHQVTFQGHLPTWHLTIWFSSSSWMSHASLMSIIPIWRSFEQCDSATVTPGNQWGFASFHLSFGCPCWCACCCLCRHSPSFSLFIPCQVSGTEGDPEPCHLE